MINEQLKADCHLLGKFEAGYLLLHRNAALPWFILVPDTDEEDVLDLEPARLHQVMEECQLVSRFLKAELAVAKVNFAGLGNVVAQMHLHIIGRSPQDPCWPQPVWGNLEESSDYDPLTLAQWRQTLSEHYGLCVTG